MAESLIGIRIILVEDHDDCREIFATMLRFHGAVVTAVANAREAIGHRRPRGHRRRAAWVQAEEEKWEEGADGHPQ